MSIEESNYFRLQVRKWDKELLEAQDRLAKTFEKTGDKGQLRSEFCNLREDYMEKCLTAYSHDLEGTGLDRATLLQTKLAFYITRFAEDLQRLFDGQQIRNGYRVFRFARAGNKLVARLITEGV